MAGADGEPVLPHALIADIGAGAYPAVMNVLLALLERDRTGKGRHLDVAMADGVLTWMYWAYGNGLAAGEWARRGAELLTGASPRYALYRTADGRHVAAAALEERFWTALCDMLDLPEDLRDDARDPEATKAAIAERFAEQSAAEWEQRFAGADVCCSIVRTVEEAAADPAFAARGLFDRVTGDGARAMTPALPLPLDPGLLDPAVRPAAPALGEHGP